MLFGKKKVEKYDTEFIKNNVYNHKGKITYTLNGRNGDGITVLSDSYLFDGNVLSFSNNGMPSSDGYWLNISLVELIRLNINQTADICKILFDKIREHINKTPCDKNWKIHISTNNMALLILNSSFKTKIEKIEKYFLENYFELIESSSRKVLINIEYKKGYPIIDSSNNVFLNYIVRLDDIYLFHRNKDILYYIEEGYVISIRESLDNIVYNEHTNNINLRHITIELIGLIHGHNGKIDKKLNSEGSKSFSTIYLSKLLSEVYKFEYSVMEKFWYCDRKFNKI